MKDARLITAQVVSPELDDALGVTWTSGNDGDDLKLLPPDGIVEFEDLWPAVRMPRTKEEPDIPPCECTEP